MTTTPGRRRVRPTKIAAAVVLLVAILEIVVIIAVGRAIGAWPTFLLIIATSLLGMWLIRREGTKAFKALQNAAQSGRMPAREIADGMLVLAGGLLLLPVRASSPTSSGCCSCCRSPGRSRAIC